MSKWKHSSIFKNCIEQPHPPFMITISSKKIEAHPIIIKLFHMDSSGCVSFFPTTPYGPSFPSYKEIGLVVSEEKINMSTSNNDGHT
jgi:hypothetical protein